MRADDRTADEGGGPQRLRAGAAPETATATGTGPLRPLLGRTRKGGLRTFRLRTARFAEQGKD